MKTISLVIINYNGRRFLERLFATIRAQTFQDFEVIFVDNDSKDDSVDYVEKNYAEAKIIRSQNLGYGTGCNIGAKNAAGKYLAFLNEDMYLPENFLEKIIAFRDLLPKQEKIGAVSCKMIDFDADPADFPPTLGGNIDLFGFPVKNKNPEDIFIVSGSPFLIKRDLFEKIGGYNEMIFIYGEDVDLSWRLKLMSRDNFVNNGTYIHHFAGGATGNFGPQKIANIVYGAFISIFTNYNIFTFVIILPFFLICGLLFYLLLTIIKFDISYVYEIMRKKIYFLKNFKKALKIREFVQKERVKSDFYILRYISLIPAFFLNNPLAKLGKNFSAKNT